MLERFFVVVVTFSGKLWTRVDIPKLGATVVITFLYQPKEVNVEDWDMEYDYSDDMEEWELNQLALDEFDEFDSDWD